MENSLKWQMLVRFLTEIMAGMNKKTFWKGTLWMVGLCITARTLGYSWSRWLTFETTIEQKTHYGGKFFIC